MAEKGKAGREGASKMPVAAAGGNKPSAILYQTQDGREENLPILVSDTASSRRSTTFVVVHVDLGKKELKVAEL